MAWMTSFCSSASRRFCEADVDALEDDVVDQREEIGDAAGIGAEDEGAELDGTAGQVIEGGAGDGDGLDIGLGDAFGGIVLVRQHAGGGQDAAFPGMDTVEKDFAPGFRDLLDAHAAGQKQQHVLRVLADFEHPGSGGQVDKAAACLQIRGDVGG